MGHGTSRFITTWNDDPSNRSKTVTLFNELKVAKEEMIANLELSLERGEKINRSMHLSEQLVGTSRTYKKTAQATNRTFCFRKYMYHLAVCLILSICILVLVLIFKP